ncbi:hypothetical protein B0H15DRAFT_329526 [Mycena belliarum]|uniref:BAG domain-containing protein n=1 Tax=Mycena belliarum TaxID=1033014 RepID=A0AAD6UG84_9AGAR|nr:hypothetical protein B0H15DRAFT_329526 [Mycena belliae]
MFHPTFYPRSQPIASPRDKYLAALAEAKAAEAEYLAAERLQQEEDALRQRLEQIQLLKHNNNTPRADFGSLYAPVHYPQSTPTPDIELLRRQIAAEERARIEVEQQQAREREAEALRRHHIAREFDAQRRKQDQAREMGVLRVHEARKAQLARDTERARTLAAQRAHLAAVTQRATPPGFHFVLANESPRQQQHGCARHARPHSHHNAADLNPAEVLQALFAPKEQNAQEASHDHAQDFLFQLFGGRAQQQSTAPVAAAAPAQPQAGSVEQQFLNQLFGRSAPVAPAAPQPQPKAQEQGVSLEQVLNHFLGKAAPQPQPSTSSVPKAETNAQQQPMQVSIEQLLCLNHFLGAEQTPSTTPEQPKAGPSETKEATPAAAPAPTQAPTPAPAAPAPAPTPAPVAQPSAPQPQAVNFQHILNQFLGGGNAPSAASPQSPPDLQQLLNMFIGGRPQHCAQPEPSSSKSSSASASGPSSESSKRREQQEKEERDLAEAIRLSLETEAPAADAKGKAPAPAPVKDALTSAAEVRAIDASFSALAAEFAFPAELEFSTSRAASPAAGEAEAPIARLSYSAKNQGVRFYQQALSGLLAQLDAVESFGDESVRHGRKEVVGRVEGALDELEAVVEARWRKWAGKVERKEEVPVAEEAPVVVDAPVEEHSAESAAIPESTSTPAVAEAAPALEAASHQPTTDSSLSYPSAAAAADLVAQSIETLRPASPSPAASPAPSEDVDTFLLPATAPEPAPKKPRAADDAEVEVGSDWSEVEA